jgi:hypothetical protein
MSADNRRVIVTRVIEMEGPREWVERAMERSISGSVVIGTDSNGDALVIRERSRTEIAEVE